MLLLAACKKDPENPVSNQPPSTFSQAFDEFWNDMNVNYVYWDIDTTNWDAIYRQYKPLFSALQLGDTADLARSVGYFHAMTDGLIYHHLRLANPTGLKAIVLEFRDNPGGDANDLNFLVGQFIGQPLVVGYTRNKSGNGRLDYTPWVDVRVAPESGVHAVTLPIFILADKYSRSMAEITAMALRTLPQCRVVGETTFGATGPFGENALYDDGPFQVPAFLSVTTSSVEFKSADGKMYEGAGFPPDYPVAYSLQALNSGDDPQMDKVLSLIP